MQLDKTSVINFFVSQILLILFRNNPNTMKWYKKYLAFYEKPFAEAPPEIVAEVREKIVALQAPEPLVTVSVIGYNEERHLLPCLWSLSEQQCKYPMEIIGVDNNSKDRTAEVFEAVGVPCFRETTPGCGHARLCGLNHARGKYHVNIDADTMYPPRYVETMVDALIKRKLVGVSSLWGYFPDREHSAFGLWFYETMRDLYLFLQSFSRPQKCVRGLVFAYDTQLARKVGIRTDIIRGEDGSLAWSLRPYGKIGFVRKRRARAITGYGTISQDGSLMSSFLIRAKKGTREAWKIVVPTRKEDIRDQESNLLKKK